MMLRLTPAQIRELADVTGEALRHWRKVLTPLRGVKGRGPSFLPGDALALMIVKCLVKEVGLQVSVLEGLSPRLFEICRTTSWPKLFGLVLRLRPAQGLIDVVKDGVVTSDGTSIVVPVAQFAEDLQGKLLSYAKSGGQIPLGLRPSVVRRTKSRAAP